MEVAAAHGACDLDAAERLLAALVGEGVPVLREDRVVAPGQPVKQVVGDARLVGAVLSVVAVGGSEGEWFM